MNGWKEVSQSYCHIQVEEYRGGAPYRQQHWSWTFGNRGPFSAVEGSASGETVCAREWSRVIVECLRREKHCI